MASSWTQTVRYFSWLPWDFGWKTKTITYYGYHFRILQRWGWGPYIRYSGCEDDGNRYSWDEWGFIFGYEALPNVSVTKESPIAVERPC